MAKQAAKTVKAKKTVKSPSKPAKKLNPMGRVIIILLSVAGLAMMGYLTSLHYKDTGSAFCDINEKLSCGVVNTSEYSELAGIPVSILGIGFFLLIIGMVLKKYTKDALKTIAFISLAFLGPSLYLTGLEIFVIESICIFCEFSKVIVFAIFGTAMFTMRPFKGAKELIMSGIITGAILAGGTFMVQRLSSEKIPEGKYNDFAQQMTDEGWIMYGSETCQFCGRQRAAFGEEAFIHIIEIECDPRNENDQAELCVAKEIDHTPTWVLEDEDGATIRKLESGMHTLEVLSEESGIPLPE